MPDTTILPPPKPQRGMVIRGLAPRLPERGKIKIGGLGEERQARNSDRSYQLPVKYDHFVVTTLERGQDGNFCRDDAIHERLGERPTRLPIRLLYDDPTLNFPTRYACYQGRTLWCAGDGHKAMRLDEKSRERFAVGCTCPLADPTIKRSATEMRCKMNGALSVLIEGASGLGGVWNFRTTSYNSIVGLLSTMSYIRLITGGPLANIPLMLTVQGRQAVNPVDGSTVHIYVVGLEFAGSISDLQAIGHQIALDRATTHLSIEHIEEEARRHLLLSAPINAPLPGDDEKVVDEFYPEQAARERMGGERTTPARPRREEFEACDEIVDDGSDANGHASDISAHVIQREEPSDGEADDAEYDASDAHEESEPAPPTSEQKGEPELADDPGAAGATAAPPARNAFWNKEKFAVAKVMRGDRVDWPQTQMALLYWIEEAETSAEIRKLQADSRATLDGLKLADKARWEAVIDRAHRRITALGEIDAGGNRISVAGMG